MLAETVNRFIKSMDDASLRYYLRDHKKQLVINEQNFRNSLMIVEELEHETELRGIDG